MPKQLHGLGKAVGDAVGAWEDGREAKEAERVRWLPPGVRGIVVGRNSQFFEEELGDDELEMLGLLEYRAAKLLVILLVVVSTPPLVSEPRELRGKHQVVWIVLPGAMLSIYFAKIHSWDGVFVANGSTQSVTVHKAWFSFFQSICKSTLSARKVSTDRSQRHTPAVASRLSNHCSSRWSS